MPNLEYTARTLTGETIAGRIRASNESEARAQLGARGYQVLDVRGGEDTGAASSGYRLTGRRVSSASLASFTAQLSLMLRTGTALVEALEALAEQTQDDRLYEVLVSVRDQVAGGATLADALATRPDAFDTFYVSAVHAGEVSGRLPEVFNRIEQSLRKRVEMRSGLLVALIYPAIVTVMAIIAVTFVMTFVLPRFVSIFEASNVALPVPTRMLMALSTFIVTYWYFLLAALVAIPALIYRYINSPRGSIVFDGIILRMPIIGHLTSIMQTALMLRTLGTLIASGVPLLDGLQVARDACKNSRFKSMVRDVADRVTRGEDLSSSFGRSDLLEPTTKQMLTTGERSGNLAKVMNALADHLDEAADKQLKRLSAIFEPLIIIFMGIAVGFIAVSILLPLFKLTAAARG